MGFRADFYRQSLAIVKQHPNNAQIWGVEACFSRFINARHWVNISSMEREIENWELKMEKKSGVLAFQKVSKTGNIEKSPVAGGINYVSYLSMQKDKAIKKLTSVRQDFHDFYQSKTFS